MADWRARLSPPLNFSVDSLLLYTESQTHRRLGQRVL